MTVLTIIRRLLTSGKAVVAGLPDDVEQKNPIDFFAGWFADADRSGLMLPEAMTLATATKNAVPSARMVLLKSFDQDGFVFYSNFGSQKAKELEENPLAALVFHWPPLQRQVRVEGSVAKISESESSIYFQSRPRGSRIGAWASKQSSKLKNRNELEERERFYKERFKGQEIPLPHFWGGYRLNPERIEFWQGKMNRLHDRALFTKDEKEWRAERLYP